MDFFVGFKLYLHVRHNGCKESTCAKGFASYRIDQWLHGLHHSLIYWKNKNKEIPNLQFILYTGAQIDFHLLQFMIFPPGKIPDFG